MHFIEYLPISYKPFIAPEIHYFDKELLFYIASHKRLVDTNFQAMATFPVPGCDAFAPGAGSGAAHASPPRRRALAPGVRAALCQLSC